jgi:hypothetical protein
MNFGVFSFYHGTSVSSPKAYKAGFLLLMNFAKFWPTQIHQISPQKKI